MNTSNTKTSYHLKNNRTMKLMPIAILFASIILLAGCEKKHNPAIIEGYILEAGTNTPIQGASIPIHIRRVIDRKSISYPIDTVYTDSSGKFYWESTENHEPLGNGTHEIGRIKKDKYFSLNWFFSLYQEVINKNSHFKQTIHLDPYAYLHLHVEDVPEVEGSFCRVWTTDNYSIEDLHGETFDDILLIKGNKMQHIYSKFNLIPNDFKKDSLYFNSLDTLYYHLKY